MTDDILYYIWLHQLKGIGCKGKRNLLQYYGTPEEVYNASEESLLRIDEITRKEINALMIGKELTETTRILFACQKHGIGVMSIQDDIYPLLAKDNPELPIALYYVGNPVVNLQGVAIVGARRCTRQGKEKAIQLSKSILIRGEPIISGMAKGIDSYALTQCVLEEGYPVAVLANGLDICYPSEHKSLMARIVDKGLLLSEYPPGTPPYKYNFPKRNRIIAACSKEIYVVEASENSGALITARYGEKYGKKIIKP